MRSLIILGLVATLSGTAALAETVRIGGVMLEEHDARRLTHYADKIVSAVTTLQQAEQAGDTSGIATSLTEAQKEAERYAAATRKAGLDPKAAEAVFMGRMAQTFTGRIPTVLAGANGLVSLSKLMELAAAGDTETAAGDYVSSVRKVGSNTFSN